MYSHSYKYGYKDGTGGSSIDADAQAYYDALNTANGGQVDYSSLYSISNETALNAYSDFAVGCKADGVYSLLHYLWPMFGGTAACHVVDFIGAASQGSLVGFPSSGAQGTTLNGTSQYFDTGVAMSTYLSQNDNSIGCLLNNSVDTVYSMGAISDGSTKALWMSCAGANKVTDNTNGGAVRLTVANSVLEKIIISTRVDANDIQMFVDGSSIGTNTTANSGGVPTNNAYFGARNNLGTADAYGAGDLQLAFLGQGLTPTQASNLTTRIKTLNAVFGR